MRRTGPACRSCHAGGVGQLFCVRGGVDLPGRLYEHMIITKLPFAPPDSPVDEALAEFIESRGGSPFDEISLPNVSEMLTRWIGRLIRTATDTGCVTLLDARLYSKGYGRKLLDTLPGLRREIGVVLAA
ncbi:helicase C-terminal domain-containing protein [Cupriavidus basilensis]